MVTTQTLGATRGFKTVLQGGAPDHKYYTQIRKVKTAVTVYPGNIVSGNGETEGECDLAASGDGAASYTELVLRRVACIPQDIDTGITATQYVETLRPSGGRFIVAVVLDDPSTDVEVGEPMVLEATGHLQKFAYGNAAAATDTLIEGLWRSAEALTDIASTDLVMLTYW